MFGEVLERLDEAITALAAVDVDAIDDTTLDAFVIAVQRARHRLAGAGATALARWDAAGVWRADGSRTAATRLARDTSTSATTAHVELRRARALTAMPATLAALKAGRVSIDHVDLLARADQPHRHELFLRAEELLVEQCATLRHRQAVRAVEYWTQLADTATGTSTEPTERVSGLHASTTWDGAVRIDGNLNRIDGAIVAGELSRLEREQYLADEAAGITRSHSERLAAALVEMATRSAATPLGRATPPPAVHRPDGRRQRPPVVRAGHRHRARPRPARPVPRRAGDGDDPVRRADDRHRRLRRAIEVRDRHCQHPSGCDVPAPDCDVDHIVTFTDGGETSQFNGRLECRPHNRDAAKHDHGARSQPERPVTEWDVLRVRMRWRYLHEDGEEEPAA